MIDVLTAVSANGRSEVNQWSHMSVVRGTLYLAKGGIETPPLPVCG